MKVTEAGELPPPRVFTPFDRGLYQVAPLLKKLDLVENSGNSDGAVFHVDREWIDYRSSKEGALADRAEKYLGLHKLEVSEFHRVAHFIAERLNDEHPRLFHYDKSLGILNCQISKEELKLNGDPLELWKALSLQVQEDLAIWKLADDREWLAAISVLSPNHWSPEDKIGHSFARVHEPVAGIESINKNARQMAETMIFKGPFTRFAWGIATDRRLNHHPTPPTGIRPEEWTGRQFDPQFPRLYIRTERQCLVPFPEIKCALFTIRTYFQEVSEIKADPSLRDALISALNSMSPESLVYKGLRDSREEIIQWIKN